MEEVVEPQETEPDARQNRSDPYRHTSASEEAEDLDLDLDEEAEHDGRRTGAATAAGPLATSPSNAPGTDPKELPRPRDLPTRMCLDQHQDVVALIGSRVLSNSTTVVEETIVVSNIMST